MAEYELRVMPVEKVRPADYNPRVALRPGDPDYEKLKASVGDLGLIDPLVWNETTGNLVGGHQRLQVCIDSGYTEVPVFVVHLSEEKEKQANLALNRIHGEWDEKKLQELLRSFSPEILKLSGFEPSDVKPYKPDQVEKNDSDEDAGMCKCPRCRFKFFPMEVN